MKKLFLLLTLVTLATAVDGKKKQTDLKLTIPLGTVCVEYIPYKEIVKVEWPSYDVKPTYYFADSTYVYNISEEIDYAYRYAIEQWEWPRLSSPMVHRLDGTYCSLSDIRDGEVVIYNGQKGKVFDGNIYKSRGNIIVLKRYNLAVLNVEERNNYTVVYFKDFKMYTKGTLSTTSLVGKNGKPFRLVEKAEAFITFDVYRNWSYSHQQNNALYHSYKTLYHS